CRLSPSLDGYVSWNQPLERIDSVTSTNRPRGSKAESSSGPSPGSATSAAAGRPLRAPRTQLPRLRPPRLHPHPAPATDLARLVWNRSTACHTVAIGDMTHCVDQVSVETRDD